MKKRICNEYWWARVPCAEQEEMHTCWHMEASDVMVHMILSALMRILPPYLGATVKQELTAPLSKIARREATSCAMTAKTLVTRSRICTSTVHTCSKTNKIRIARCGVETKHAYGGVWTTPKDQIYQHCRSIACCFTHAWLQH